MSGSTWAAYEKVWSEWATFTRLADAGLGEQDLRLLVVYFVSRHMEGGGSVSAIERKLAGLAFLFKLQGLTDFTKDFWVKQALKGYRKSHAKKDSRRPVSFSLLQVLRNKLGGVCKSGYEVILFKAVFSIAFFGAFRVGELVSPAKQVAGGLKMQDVEVKRDRVLLKLGRSKTDQAGKGVKVQLFRLPGSGICPVQVVEEFLLIRPVGEGPLFVHEDRTFLSRFQFIAVFRKCIGAAGLDSRQFASHSFRIGVATEAARCGLDEAAIKRIGRWESRRFQSYVRPQLSSDAI